MADPHNDPFHHVRDSQIFEFPEFVHAVIPKWLVTLPTFNIAGYEFHVTKYMMLQLLALAVAFLIFRGLAKRVQNGGPVRGAWWNFWEALAVFVRDEVVRPSIAEPHHHGHGPEGAEHHGDQAHNLAPAHAHSIAHLPGEQAALVTPHGGLASTAHYSDKFLPFIWSLFFYILFCNLFGTVPFLGAATSDTSITGVLAVSVLVVTLAAGIQQLGVAGYFKSLVPGMDVPKSIGVVLIPMIWVIEFLGLLIKHLVLAIRLFANMLAGHVVIAVFLSFIAMTANSGVIWYLVTPASIFGQLAIGALELFVAFLQAYVFSLLASIFIGTAVNPH